MGFTKNYYEILGLDEDCSDEDINRKFKELAMRYHPDKSPSHFKKQTEEMFKNINEARDVLLNDRFSFDQWLNNIYKKSGYKASQESRDYTKKEEDKPKPEKGSDIYKDVSLFDYQLGTTIYINQISLAIPKDAKVGLKLRKAGLGNPGKNGGSSGDMYFIIKEVINTSENKTESKKEDPEKSATNSNNDNKDPGYNYRSNNSYNNSNNFSSEKTNYTTRDDLSEDQKNIINKDTLGWRIVGLILPSIYALWAGFWRKLLFITLPFWLISTGLPKYSDGRSFWYLMALLIPRIYVFFWGSKERFNNSDYLKSKITGQKQEEEYVKKTFFEKYKIGVYILGFIAFIFMIFIILSSISGFSGLGKIKSCSQNECQLSNKSCISKPNNSYCDAGSSIGFYCNGGYKLEGGSCKLLEVKKNQNTPTEYRFGIYNCDKYLELMDCIVGKTPDAQKADAQKMYDQAISTWKSIPVDQIKAVCDKTMNQLDSQKDTFKALGCEI